MRKATYKLVDAFLAEAERLQREALLDTSCAHHLLQKALRMKAILDKKGLKDGK